MQSLESHLAEYGIRRFDSVEEWKVEVGKFPREIRSQFKKLQRPLRKNPSVAQLTQFYDFIAHHDALAGVVHSIKADTMLKSGIAVTDVIAGRSKVLDVGCNMAHLTTWYSSQEERRLVMGVDRCTAALDQARRFGVPARVKLECADLLTLELKEQFDAIVDTQTLYSLDRNFVFLTRVRESLSADAIFVSIPPIYGPNALEHYISTFSYSRFSLSELHFIYFKDRGYPDAYPVLVFRPSGASLHVDFYSEYGAVASRLSEMRERQMELRLDLHAEYRGNTYRLIKKDGGFVGQRLANKKWVTDRIDNVMRGRIITEHENAVARS